MTHMIPEEAVARGLIVLRSAFEPLRCVAELHDYDNEARFRIFDTADRALLKMEKIKPFAIADRRLLAEIIEAARTRLESDGIVLKAWKMPPA